MRACPWEGFHDLLARPLSGRIFGDIEMNHLSSSVREYGQHEE